MFTCLPIYPSLSLYTLMNLVQFAQTLINGLMLGGTFALVGLGFSIVWGIMNLIQI